MESYSVAASLDPFLGWSPLGLLCTPAWHGAGHPWFFRPAEEPLILGWKQSAREKQHYLYMDAHRADPEQGALGPILMAE